MPRPAIHPGEILADELSEIGVTPTELSRQIDVPPNRVSQIIHGFRSVTGDTALRLGHWFGTSAQFWLNLQSAYDIRVANEKVGREIARLPKALRTIITTGERAPSEIAANERRPAAGIDGRHRDKNGEIARKYGNTRVKTLRKIYGANFAPAFSPDDTLASILSRLDELSLSHLIRDANTATLARKIAGRARPK